MREFEIINSADKNKDAIVAGDLLTKRRWNQLYPEVTSNKLLKFVDIMVSGGGNKFCVSRADEQTKLDPDLMFFKLEKSDGNFSGIKFVGKGNIGGSIGVYNQYAAQTWGYWVLKI